VRLNSEARHFESAVAAKIAINTDQVLASVQKVEQRVNLYKIVRCFRLKRENSACFDESTC
jgi:hypothetical protein